MDKWYIGDPTGSGYIELEEKTDPKNFQKKSQPGILGIDQFEEHLFDILSEDQNTVNLNRFLGGLKHVGLRLTDPRLKETVNTICTLNRITADNLDESIPMDKKTFNTCIKKNLGLIQRAFTGNFVVPEFDVMCNKLKNIFDTCSKNTTGSVASYNNQLSKYSKDSWGMALTTVDGQRFGTGDSADPFPILSCCKPINYAIALHELGAEQVHQFVGQEPSGELQDSIKLDYNHKAHNPLINTGAIVIASLLKNKMSLADRFESIGQLYAKFCGGDYFGFNNSVFLAEREVSDRNFALAYYLKENKCFPDGIDIKETMDFYMQLSAVEMTCESMSVVAATLANGGINPLTGEVLLDGEAVRNTLSLMHCCGMYDYSGQFAFHVGLPGKSGRSGAIMLVVPNVMGICLWSPPLDSWGNSARGIQFCDELVNNFNFHHFASSANRKNQIDPRYRTLDKQSSEVVTLLFGASNGDLGAITRMSLSGGIDMTTPDYDGRTALHLAAAEGHLDIVRFLVEYCEVPINLKDRWGHTPMDDALKFHRDDIVEYLENNQNN